MFFCVNNQGGLLLNSKRWMFHYKISWPAGAYLNVLFNLSWLAT